MPTTHDPMPGRLPGGNGAGAADGQPLPRPLLIGNEWVTTRAGGLNRYLADLVRALERLGARPTAVVVGPVPVAAASGAARSDAPLPRRLAAVRRVAARHAAAADVVDAHFALYALAPLLTTRLRRLPLVVHFHGPWADESALGREEGAAAVAAKRTVERLVYRRADAVVVLSAAFGRLLVERYGVDPSRVVVMPPGVDVARFHPGDVTAARKSLGLAGVDPPSFVAVTVRRLDARMGIDVLLEAWRTVQAERPDAVLLIAGEGRERARLEALRASLPDPAGVRLLGRVSDDDLVTLYQAADVSIVPSRGLEGFGLVTLESLACGTPPVVTDVGGLPDAVAPLDPSLVVPPEDPSALAARILRAATGDAPPRDACRAHAETFAWDEVARRHVEVYRRATGRRPTRVAYLGHTAALSGGELSLSRALPALTDVEAHVILGEDGPLVERLRDAGSHVEVLDMGTPSRCVRKDAVAPSRLPARAVLDTLAYSFRLARRLRRLRPDVVHTNTLKAALYGGIAGRLAGVPVVWHLRDRIARDYLPGPAVTLVRLAALALPAAVVANSDATRATLGPWRTRATVVPSPVTPPAPRPGRRHDGPLTVGLVGRLAPWKGQDLFLRAFARAFPTGEVSARVVGSALFGEDDWAASLPALAEHVGIADRVAFTGFVDDMAAEYAGLDVLVHASTVPEPFGQVVVEGMAAGLPVVVPDTGGPAEVVRHGVEGLVYEMGSVEGLAERLRQLAGDGELRDRLGRAGRTRATDFAPERVARSLEAVYRDVLTRHRRARRG